MCTEDLAMTRSSLLNAPTIAAKPPRREASGLAASRSSLHTNKPKPPKYLNARRKLPTCRQEDGLDHLTIYKVRRHLQSASLGCRCRVCGPSILARTLCGLNRCPRSLQCPASLSMALIR